MVTHTFIIVDTIYIVIYVCVYVKLCMYIYFFLTDIIRSFSRLGIKYCHLFILLSTKYTGTF